MTVLLGLKSISELLECPAARIEWLGADERVRLEAMNHPQRRDQFRAGHALARELLTQQHGGHARDWTLERGEHGEPRVLRHGQPFRAHLSIAHSGDQVLCAVASRLVGVDIEHARRERDWLALATALYPSEFVEQMNQLDAVGSQHHFLQRWTLDEALAKAQGLGLRPKELRTQVWSKAEGSAAQAWSWHRSGRWLALVCDGNFDSASQFWWYGESEPDASQVAWRWDQAG
jgi:phosphopantetheinyl transferase